MPAVTENELGAFVTKLIEKYTELISQLSDTCDPNTQVYASKSRDLRNDTLKEFDTEFGRKEPIRLVTEQRLTLIARLDTKDMECMTKVKEMGTFTTALDQIRADEQQLVNTAIELIVMKYRELFHRVLMSKFYIPSDLNAIHNQLVPKCVVLLAQCCAFTSAQSDLENMCARKCQYQLSDAFTHIKVEYTSKLRRLFALNNIIVKDMDKRYCDNIDNRLAANSADVDQLQRLLESELNNIMNTFAALIDPIGREWDRHLVSDIELKHRQSLNRVLFERMRDYRIANSRGVSSVSKAISVLASPPVADAVQEFSQLCADIKARLETCPTIATKKRIIGEKLVECEIIVKIDANKAEQQKQELLRVIKGLKLTDKLIIS